jgi:hypothetical protein
MLGVELGGPREIGEDRGRPLIQPRLQGDDVAAVIDLLDDPARE